MLLQIAQQRCEECGGSGLVLREKEYFRCPECGMIAFTSSHVLYYVQAIKYEGVEFQCITLKYS